MALVAAATNRRGDGVILAREVPVIVPMLLDDARSECCGNGCAAFAHAELVIDVLEVVFDGVIGNVQAGRNFVALSWP